MARRIIDQKTYAKLVAGYEEKPGNHASAARAAGCSWHMARRAYERGWASQPWAAPIGEALETARRAVRAPREPREGLGALLGAAAHIGYQVGREVEAAGKVQSAAMGLLEVVEAAMAELVPLVAAAARRMTEAARSADGDQPDLRELMTYVREIGRTSQVAAGLLEASMKAHRLAAPQEPWPPQPRVVTPAEVSERIQEAMDGLARVAEGGLLPTAVLQEFRARVLRLGPT